MKAFLVIITLRELTQYFLFKNFFRWISNILNVWYDKKMQLILLSRTLVFLICSLSDTEGWCVFPHCIFRSSVMCRAKNFLSQLL